MTRIQKIQKSIELQKRIRANVEACRNPEIAVDILDTDRILANCDDMIETLEHRLAQVERR